MLWRTRYKLQVLLSSKYALLFIYSYISFSETNERDGGKFKISGKTERFRRKKGYKMAARAYQDLEIMKLKVIIKAIPMYLDE